MNCFAWLKTGIAAALLALGVMLVAGPTAAWAEGNKNAVSKDAKLSPQYIQMPRMDVAVAVDGTEASRELQVELWVYMPDPKIMQKLNMLRSTIADTIRAQMKKNTAQAYLAADEGPQLIKEIARDAVEAQLGKDTGEDILIKKMIVR